MRQINSSIMLGYTKTKIFLVVKATRPPAFPKVVLPAKSYPI